MSNNLPIERRTRHLEDDLLRAIARDPEYTGFDYALPVMFEAVDAGLWEFFRRFTIDPIVPDRKQVTSGSVRYELQHARKPALTYGLIHLRLVAPNVTRIALQYGKIYHQLPSERVLALKGLISFVAHAFVRWLQNDTNQAIIEAEHLIVTREPRTWQVVDLEYPHIDDPKAVMGDFAAAAMAAIATQKQPRGGPTDPDNDWVRQQIAFGLPRNEIFKTYLARQNVDPGNKDAVRQARERFKKAIGRARGRE